MLLDFHPAALNELDAAVIWIEREREDYGRLLYEEVRRRVAQAARLPKSGAPVAGFDTRYDVRSYILRRFEYQVITAIVNDATAVIAVAHTKRDPEYWRDRLK